MCEHAVVHLTVGQAGVRRTQLGDGIANNGKRGSRRSQTRAEFTPGEFITPHGAIFLNNGDILVAEWLPIGRLTLLRKLS